MPKLPNIRDCITRISGLGKLSPGEASQFLKTIQSIAEERAKKSNGNIEDAIKSVAMELSGEEDLRAKIEERNLLLNIQAKQRITSFADKFPTVGEGLRAFLEGSPHKITGARLSVDYQGKALYGENIGKLVLALEQDNLLKDFRSGDPILTQDIYREMAELGVEGGEPGKTGNDKAQRIAQIVEGITSEMVTRQNEAGAYIRKLPGYVIRQTHDRNSIRLAGNDQPGWSLGKKDASFAAWSNFILPLLDYEKTFLGSDPKQFLKLVHEELYSGIPGPNIKAELLVNPIGLNVAKKVSQPRALHFKDGDSAFAYNQAFGTKNFKDAVLQDVFIRSKQIALMENLGPNPGSTFETALRELGESVRTRDDAARQGDSLRDWRIKAAFNEVTGLNDHPANITLHRVASNVRALSTMARMGGTFLSSLADKAFLQAEMSFQGISTLETFGKQITGLIPRSAEDTARLRLMGVAMDGLIGNTISRYSIHDAITGRVHNAQQKFFSLNFMNWWTDNNKASAAELMSAHLGENSHLAYRELPEDLKGIFNLYEIADQEWDLIRAVASEKEGVRYITPEKITDRLTATKLRTYFSDRVDYAVPTPGASERKWSTFNTQSGTPLGEGVRMLTMFRSFPITVISKIMQREVYGHGAKSLRQFLTSDHQGKFRMAQLIAMTTIGGYISGVIKDALLGKHPKPLTTKAGGINYATLNDAALRGGGLGIMGDFLLQEYDRSMRSFMTQQAGPVSSQLDSIFSMGSKLTRGKSITKDAGKFAMDNTPFINLFYIRPILNYFILWNIEEMMDPGILKRREKAVKKKYEQTYFAPPSKTTK